MTEKWWHAALAGSLIAGVIAYFDNSPPGFGDPQRMLGFLVGGAVIFLVIWVIKQYMVK